MKCAQARRLFGAYWDDETTQAEREWLESHFTSCAGCRHEYEAYARTLEIAASLPRVEASPDLVERALARARRAAAVPDRIPVPHVQQWIPATAAAAAVLILASAVSPWLGMRPGGRDNGPVAIQKVRQPERVPGATVTVTPTLPATATVTPGSSAQVASGLPDSLFDHSEDIEFVLDPMTVRRGRVTTVRPPAAVQGEQAIITF